MSRTPWKSIPGRTSEISSTTIGDDLIAIDTNILVYAHRQESPFHTLASGILRSLSEGGQEWAIPWPCCYEFLSVVTNRRIWKDNPTPVERAWQQLIAWSDSPSNRMIGETEGFLEILSTFIQRPRVRGSVVHDARVAAICVAHGAEVLLTRDRDFSLFPELRIRDPIRV